MSRLLLPLLFLPSILVAQDRPAFPLNAKRVLFLGDSITHAGGYIVYLEAELIARGVEPRPELINLGLPSETCSGMSEDNHPFPRPNVHERIDRALTKLKPDVVVACYGMNDGIYHPFGEQRFAAYKAGIEKIEQKTKAAGAKLVLMTPTLFDPSPKKPNANLRPLGADEYSWKTPYKDYDKDVLQKYGEWILTRTKSAQMIVNLRKPLLADLKAKRSKDAMFVMAPDGVHINDSGHAMVAAAIANAWGLEGKLQAKPELVALVRKKQNLMHGSWLTHVGHKRPGMKAGMPLERAQAQAEKLDEQIQQLVK
jgi:lysophospholipase L1-like esterase